DRDLLEAEKIPLTVFDLSLDRLRNEAGISTAEVVKAAKEVGDVSLDGLVKAAKNIVKDMQASPRPAPVPVNDNTNQKPFLILGDSVSPETAVVLKNSGRFNLA